jgi:hypothetical protein
VITENKKIADLVNFCRNNEKDSTKTTRPVTRENKPEILSVGLFGALNKVVGPANKIPINRKNKEKTTDPKNIKTFKSVRR